MAMPVVRSFFQLLRLAVLWTPFAERALFKLFGNSYEKWLIPEDYALRLYDQLKQERRAAYLESYKNAMQ